MKNWSAKTNIVPLSLKLEDFLVGDIGSYLIDKEGFIDSLLSKTKVEWKDVNQSLHNAGWRAKNDLVGPLAFHNKSFICIHAKYNTKVFVYKADSHFFLYVCVFGR